MPNEANCIVVHARSIFEQHCCAWSMYFCNFLFCMSFVWLITYSYHYIFFVCTVKHFGTKEEFNYWRNNIKINSQKSFHTNCGKEGTPTLTILWVHIICICSSRGARLGGNCLPYLLVSFLNSLVPAVCSLGPRGLFYKNPLCIQPGTDKNWLLTFGKSIF